MSKPAISNMELQAYEALKSKGNISARELGRITGRSTASAARSLRGLVSKRIAVPYYMGDRRVYTLIK